MNYSDSDKNNRVGLQCWRLDRICPIPFPIISLIELAFEKLVHVIVRELRDKGVLQVAKTVGILFYNVQYYSENTNCLIKLVVRYIPYMGIS